MAYTVHALGNILTFEDWLFNAAAQEWQQRGRQGPLGENSRSINIFGKKRYWSIIPIHRKKDSSSRDTVPPSIKHVYRHTEIKELYRWGIDEAKTGNHRLLFVIYESRNVLLLHHFNKTYNGAIRRPDIVPAE